MAGVDGSDASVAALRWAVRQAGLTGAAVDAVMAWQRPAPVGGWGMAPLGVLSDYDFAGMAAQVLSSAVAQAGGGAGVRQLVREGNPAQVLLEESKGAALLVVGNRGHGGFTGLLLGSVSQQCVHHAACPVVVIRAADR